VWRARSLVSASHFRRNGRKAGPKCFRQVGRTPTRHHNDCPVGAVRRNGSTPLGVAAPTRASVLLLGTSRCPGDGDDHDERDLDHTVRRDSLSGLP
jgi:hypothetical protein